ncbi:unnamed protein product [Withania somnifera]
MNMYACQQKTLVDCVGETGRADISVSNGVVCPKPRKLGPFNSASVNVEEPIRPCQFLQFRNQEMEARDMTAGTELLDIILTKGNYEVDKANFEVASSPPFFYGSPPSRAGNPLIQDAQFGNHNIAPILPIPERAVAPSPPPPSTIMSGGGCVRAKFGNKPAPVRIEGFNCRGNCSISAVA